jgi:hypothetical protein
MSGQEKMARTRWENQTREQIAEGTESARRAARYKAAKARIDKIVAGMPPLTAEEREQLALLLNPGGSHVSL